MERTKKVQIWKDVAGNMLDKCGELANTYDMPFQTPVDKPKNSKTAIKKAAEAYMSPHVNVAGQEAAAKVASALAQYYALPRLQLYPLDSYTQVKTAARYFADTYKFMPPSHRHEYCENLCKRASDLSIPVDQLIEKYGSSTYAPAADVDVCLNARRSAIDSDEFIGILDKLAELRTTMPPNEFAVTLGEFDKLACITHFYGDAVPDPYYTTFGKVATPQESEADPAASILVGNEYITVRKLVEFAKNNYESLSLRFGPEFAEEFQKSPQEIFNSLPRDQKLVVMRMANTSDSQIYGATTA